MAFYLTWYDKDTVTQQTSWPLYPHVNALTPVPFHRGIPKEGKRNLSNWNPTNTSLPSSGNLQMSVTEILNLEFRPKQWFYSCLGRECWSTGAGAGVRVSDIGGRVFRCNISCSRYGMCLVRCSWCKEGYEVRSIYIGMLVLFFILTDVSLFSFYPSAIFRTDQGLEATTCQECQLFLSPCAEVHFPMGSSTPNTPLGSNFKCHSAINLVSASQIFLWHWEGLYLF